MQTELGVPAAVPLDRLESHLWEAANILRGPVDAADFKTYIFPLLFFKRLSDTYDDEVEAALEESGGDQQYALFPELHRFAVPEGHHWRDVFDRTQNIGAALKAAFRAIELANERRLYGIFGDAQWTNKDRLPDRLLRQLLDHFHRLPLGNAHVREDVMGQAYEYLIKRFADQSNKKAGEFYTPRSVVRLMVNVLDPRPGESVYDPACGTGGMLLETLHHVREGGGEWRTLKIRGQEKNLTTQAVARMNLLLHGVEDFAVVHGDTLRAPGFHRDDRLERFDCVVANPPFSLKNWGRDAWTSDPYGRNLYGLAPDSTGDYAWVAHMLASMRPEVGRVAVVLPHGVLFRGGKEGAIRERLLEDDLLEAVIGLGANLFYGAGLPAAVLVFRGVKPEKRRGRVLIVDASDIYTPGRAQNVLTDEQADEIYGLYLAGQDVEGVARSVSLAEIAENDWTLNVARYVQKPVEDEAVPVAEALAAFKSSMNALADAERQLDVLLAREGLSA